MSRVDSWVTGFAQTRQVCLSMMGQYQGFRGVHEASISQASFQRRYRLISTTDYERVFKGNRRSVDESFTVLYRRNGLGYPRLGLVIAKKTVRSAVVRNRLKRIIRESFRSTKQQLTDLDIVIMARRNTGTSSKAKILLSLARHWQTLNRCKEAGSDGPH
jgi:ribonuclease P protein component